MKYKHVLASRELRLWVGQIVIPTITLGVTLMNVPEVRQTFDETVYKIKKAIKSKKRV